MTRDAARRPGPVGQLHRPRSRPTCQQDYVDRRARPRRRLRRAVRPPVRHATLWWLHGTRPPELVGRPTAATTCRGGRTRDPWAVLVSRADAPADPGAAGRAAVAGVPRAVPHAGGVRGGRRRRRRPGVGRASATTAGPSTCTGARRRWSSDHGGALPDDLDALLALPGIGPYTARAVLVFAFERDIGLVDTNAGRFVARALAGRAARGRRRPRRVADAAVPPGDGLGVGPGHVRPRRHGVHEAGARAATRCPLARRRCAWAARRLARARPGRRLGRDLGAAVPVRRAATARAGAGWSTPCAGAGAACRPGGGDGLARRPGPGRAGRGHAGRRRPRRRHRRRRPPTRLTSARRSPPAVAERALRMWGVRGPSLPFRAMPNAGSHRRRVRRRARPGRRRRRRRRPRRRPAGPTTTRCSPTTWPTPPPRSRPPAALLDYGAKGDVEAAHHLRLRGRRRRRPRRQAASAGRRRGASTPGALDGARRVRRRPTATRRSSPSLAGERRAPPPRRRLRAGAGHLPALRRGEDRSRSPSTSTATTPTSPRTIIAGLAEMGAFGLSVPEEYGGFGGRRRVRLHRHGRRHRGAVPRLARRRRLAHHPARDPHPGPGRRAAPRSRSSEWLPKLATGRGAWTRSPSPSPTSAPTSPASRSPPPTTDGGWLDQRREDVVHLRRPGRRAHAAGPHRPRPLARPTGACRCSSSRSRGARATASSSPTAGGGKMEGRPIDTIGYRGMHSYEVAFDNWFVPADNLIGGEDGPRQGLLLPDGGLRERPPADRGPGRRRHAGRLRGGPPVRRRPRRVRPAHRRLPAHPGEARPAWPSSSRPPASSPTSWPG